MELVRLLLRLMHWSGALRHPSPVAGCYPLYSAALLCLTACFVATQVAAVVDRQAGADLDQATLALCVASTMCVAICKVLNILRSEQLFLRLAHELVVVGVVAVVVPCSDLFTVACVQRLGTLLRILERRVERLGAAASAPTPGGQRPTPATGRAVAGADPLHRALRDCVSLHQRIISEAECLNRAVGGALLPQVVASAAGICFLLFQVAKKTSFHVVETGKLLGYLTFMLSQLLFYCWFGDDMLSKSERVALAAYRCAWPGAPTNFQRSLLLVSMRARKPLTLRAGKFFVFSRQAFVQVMNVSYSYFTVLRSLSEA
ncbi:odorant receptor Or2-like [Schistocerca americana]|uniref:odorant receptor Or2-like n=1 Tax=Schistocerca americana TaxID=7009 RepID=UPI001F4FDC20|nr:odorant receptor Or2-like [Schistocerca americana]